MLVAPWVAAQMTDLLQAAVMTGTGRAAQIGRPVAGKTGTTSSNKDGWFIGFSSGLTTGVWMGRDDAKALPGLQGGRAPAGAFHDFMVKAVADRPAENFEIEVALPDWQIEPDEEVWFEAPDEYMMVDENGNPLGPPPGVGLPFPEPGTVDPGLADPSSRDDQLDQDWLDRAVGRDRPPPREPPPPPRRQGNLPPLPQQRQSVPPAEPVERGAVPPQP